MIKIEAKIPENPIFIVSSGRAGTTLLRSIINRTKQVYIPFESDFVARGYPYFGNVKSFDKHTLTQTTNLFMRAALGIGWKMERDEILNVLKHNSPDSFAKINHIIYSFYLHHNDITGKTWAIKTPVLIENLDRIIKTFPNARVVHLVRDGRDVCLSYKNVHQVRQGTDRFGPRSLLANALFWVDGLRRVKKFKVTHEELFELRYEDMVSKPEQTITRLFNFLDIPFDPSVLENENLADKFFLNTKRPTIHQNIGKPLLKTNIHKYKRQMPKRDRLVYELINNPFLKKYGYDIEFSFTNWIIFDIIRIPMYIAAQVFNNFKNRKKDKRYFEEAMSQYN